MKYKHIIFDIDGTMLDSAYADLTALQRLLYELQNRNYPINDIRFVLGIPAEVALKQLGVKDASTGSKLWSSYMQELSHTMKLFDGIKELLVELKNRGTKLGIITSKNREEFRYDFTPLGIDQYFDTIITVEDSDAPKPSAEPMLSYISKTKTSHSQLLYVGDTIYDSKCASSAGVDFGLAMWGCHDADQIPATHYFETPKHILDMISK